MPRRHLVHSTAGGQYQMLAPPYYDQNGSLMMGNTRAVRLMPPVLVNPAAPGTSAPSQPGELVEPHSLKLTALSLLMIGGMH